jgi:ABC-2 type transport system ATP-binding protein
VILAGGRLVAAGEVEDLKAEQAERYRVVLAGAEAHRLGGLAGIRLVEGNGSQGLVELDGLAPEHALGRVTDEVGPVAEFARVVRPLSQIYREAVA